jgi:hypothetical protein
VKNESDTSNERRCQTLKREAAPIRGPPGVTTSKERERRLNRGVPNSQTRSRPDPGPPAVTTSKEGERRLNRGVPNSQTRSRPDPGPPCRNDKQGARATFKWSGRLDLNQRPLRPERSALPNCATPRLAAEYDALLRVAKRRTRSAGVFAALFIVPLETADRLPLDLVSRPKPRPSLAGSPSRGKVGQ